MCENDAVALIAKIDYRGPTYGSRSYTPSATVVLCCALVHFVCSAWITTDHTARAHRAHSNRRPGFVARLMFDVFAHGT